MGLEVKEEVISLERLLTFDGCFLVGTACEVTSVGEIDGIYYEINPLTKKIKTSYKNI